MHDTLMWCVHEPTSAYARVVHAARALATLLVVAALGAGVTAALGSGSTLSPPTLGPDGIGPVRFGMTKLNAVAGLSDLLGAPSARGVNTGCGPRYTEVEWGDLVAEFRLSTFSGFRYLTGGWPITTPSSPREASPPRALFPKLATSERISLGNTLAQLRVAYGVLRFVGTDRWRSLNGLVFVDDAKPIGEPRLRHIIEIKVKTCGDF
jgi:hypothetical protein